MFRNIFLKKYKIYTLGFLLAGGLSSCDSDLDIDPITEQNEETFFQTNDNLSAALTGAYHAFRGAYASNHILWGELRSDNHVGLGGSANATIPSNNIDTNHSGARWGNLYAAINRVNTVILGATKLSNPDRDILAQAYAMRSNLYFNAIRVWGDVPLYTEPVDVGVGEIFRIRTSADFIMSNVIIPDMLRAEELSTVDKNDFGFSESSILAHQAEVYMWIDDYENAKVALNKFFALGSHSFVNTPEEWRDMFFNGGIGRKVQTGSELIMSLRFDLAESPNSTGFPNNFNRSGLSQIYKAGALSVAMSESVENKWAQKFPLNQEEWEERYPDTNPVLSSGGEFVYGDWRYYFSRERGVAGVGTIENGQARTGKWSDAILVSQSDDTDIVLYRYADMFLLLAEAELLTGNPDKALEMINTLRTTRLLPTASNEEFGFDLQQRLNFLLDERQLELFGEAKRWWDLVRNDLAISTINNVLQEQADSEGETNDFTLTELTLLWPINVIHLSSNPNISQNQGY